MAWWSFAVFLQPRQVKLQWRFAGVRAAAFCKVLADFFVCKPQLSLVKSLFLMITRADVNFRYKQLAKSPCCVRALSEAAARGLWLSVLSYEIIG